MKITGLYDCHIHGGPEPIPRKYDFITMSRNMEEAGMAGLDRKSTRLNSSHLKLSRMPSSA